MARQKRSAGNTLRQDESVYMLHRKYMKDSSFENPGAPANAAVADPKINIGVKIAATRGGDLYEIELGYRVEATKDGTILFLAEVAYAGLFEVSGASDAQLARFIYVEAPRKLYPHAEKIITDAVRDGGLPDLTLEEPDFLAIWQMRGHRGADAELTLPEAAYETAFGSSMAGNSDK